MDQPLQCVWEDLPNGMVRCVRCLTIKPAARERLCGNFAIAPCQHFLGATKETVKVFGCDCPGASENGIDITICECELDAHPRCIVFDRGTDLSDPSIVRCSTCPDRTRGTSQELNQD